jgi:hypothetical protein
LHSSTSQKSEFQKSEFYLNKKENNNSFSMKFAQTMNESWVGFAIVLQLPTGWYWGGGGGFGAQMGD